jgi:hypothetical protein
MYIKLIILTIFTTDIKVSRIRSNFSRITASRYLTNSLRMIYNENKMSSNYLQELLFDDRLDNDITGFVAWLTSVRAMEI